MKKSAPDFLNGLVFGFDIGTGSIGWAVRRGSQFLNVGVLICDSEGSDLSKRRDLRRQRRTLRSRKYRRRWFAKELEKLGLPRPQDPPADPIGLRLRALNGEELKPEELHTALTHLFKRRGYTEVPWKTKAEKRNENAEAEKEEGEINQKMSDLRAEMKRNGFRFPCGLLEWRIKNKAPQRREVWPRELLRDEFLAILEALKAHFPYLAEKAEWLLYGDTREFKGHHIFTKSTEARNPGVLGLRWPRFDNRGPALDSFTPLDNEGRPLHVVRKNKAAFLRAQWELALMNFRVLDAQTRQKLDPRLAFPEFIAELRKEWDKKQKVTVARMRKLASSYADRFLLIENHESLTPETGAGRARYSSPTLDQIRVAIDAGQRVDPPQPVLKRDGEDNEDALNRYLSEIKHPLVRHRLTLFRNLLRELIHEKKLGCRTLSWSRRCEVWP